MVKPSTDEGNAEVTRDWTRLVGYEAAFERLAATAHTLPPVLLLEGRAGIGKSTFAAAVAASAFCHGRRACGSCEPCRLVASGKHPEMLWLGGEEGPLKIADAALLQDHLALNPSASFGHPSAELARVVVVPDADRFTVQAANRLLKTLEEPPAFARIILTTSRANTLLPTVLSRCVRWLLAPPPLSESVALLARLWKESQAEPLAPEEFERLLLRSGLSPGKALEHRGAAAAQRARIRELLWQLLGREAILEVLSAAEELARGCGIAMRELLEEAELCLNERYRERLQQGQSEDPLLLARRRDLLRQLKRLALRRQVALNTQLATEALGLLPHVY